MTDSTLKRFLAKVEPPKEAAEATPELDDLGAFGVLRGTHDRAIMLELHKKDGTIESFSYGLLARATFQPSEGIQLRFGGTTVKIIGRHLNTEIRPNIRLFSAISRHRVPWIREVDEPESWKAPREATVIEEIKIQ
jgi:hypothetical protein